SHSLLTHWWEAGPQLSRIVFRLEADERRNSCRCVNAVRTRWLWHNDVWRPDLGLVGDRRMLVLQHLIDQHHDYRKEEKAKQQSSPKIRLPVWNALAAGDDPWHSPEHEEQCWDRLNEWYPPRNVRVFGFAHWVWTYIGSGNPTSSHWVAMVQLRGGRSEEHT